MQENFIHLLSVVPCNLSVNKNKFQYNLNYEF